MSSAQSRSCALPGDGLNGCPPGVHSCSSCPWWQLDGRAARTEERERERARVVDALHFAGARGLTVEQLAARTRISETAVRVALVELQHDGQARRRRGRRRTRAGGRAAVFVEVRQPNAEVQP